MGRNRYHNFDKYPEKKVEGYPAYEGWDAVRRIIREETESPVVAAEFYPEVHREELVRELTDTGYHMVDAESCCVSNEAYHRLIDPFLTDDRVFGIMNTLKLTDIYETQKIEETRAYVNGLVQSGERVILYGVGAAIVAGETADVVYFDMPRWEIQCRFKEGMSNWKTENGDGDRLKKFKQGFFVEWRMADRHKRELLDRMGWVVDTVAVGNPKIVSGDGFRQGLKQLSREPFRLVPYYAPEVWGGQWMREICEIDGDADNYAWAFDGVPEENSIFLRFGEVRMEFPAIDVVFYRPKELLGSRVHARFGDEFPIRFDFLDTVGGQNLSLQVHPLTEYIQNTFGMHYTQDESYYILDCSDDAVVYLGLKEGIDKDEMLRELEEAQAGGRPFAAEKQDKDTGIYYNGVHTVIRDHVRYAGEINRDLYGYNAGSMILADLLLYEITRQESYKEDAVWAARAAHQAFLRQDETGWAYYKDFVWFTAILAEGYDELARIDPDSAETGKKTLRESLMYAWEHYRSGAGLLPHDYVTGWRKEDDYDRLLLTHSGTAEIACLLGM